MPRTDGTGPLRRGPRTGRGLGDCFIKDTPSNKENTGNVFGFGKRDGTGPLGRVPRTGRGFGNCSKLK